MYQNNRPTNGTPGKPPVDLRAKYQLPPQPANVQKIAGLTKGRQDASMDEIAEIISTDSNVTQKLMSIAYPKAAARIGATVQMATSRLGVNKVIVVLVGDLLTKAVLETFETMVGMHLEPADAQTVSMPDYKFLTGSVRFAGQTNGQVTLAFSAYLTMVLSAQLLGGNVDEHSPEAVNDIIGELVNIVTGNLQSKLCDAGLNSEVGLPVVQFATALPAEAVPGGSNDRFFFHCGTHTLAACLSIDPSAQKPKMAPSTHGTTWRANGL